MLQDIVHSEPLVKTHNQVTAANWSPHHGTNQIAVAMDTNLQVVDLRSINKGSVYSIENAHIEPIRDLDFNPNRQYYMATCGDDGCTKFWDVRNISRPVLSRHDHYHWYLAFGTITDETRERVLRNNVFSFTIGYGKYVITYSTISWC